MNPKPQLQFNDPSTHLHPYICIPNPKPPRKHLKILHITSAAAESQHTQLNSLHRTLQQTNTATPEFEMTRERQRERERQGDGPDASVHRIAVSTPGRVAAMAMQMAFSHKTGWTSQRWRCPTGGPPVLVYQSNKCPNPPSPRQNLPPSK